MFSKNDLLKSLQGGTKKNRVAALDGLGNTVVYDEDVEVFVVTRGVTQRRVMRTEEVIEAGKSKLLLFIEEEGL